MKKLKDGTTPTQGVCELTENKGGGIRQMHNYVVDTRSIIFFLYLFSLLISDIISEQCVAFSFLGRQI